MQGTPDSGALLVRPCAGQVTMRMYRGHNENTGVPARVQAALAVLTHCRFVTDQHDVSIPARQLTPAEKRVEQAALRVLVQYLSGEMDFGDVPPRDEGRGPDEDPGQAV